MGSPAYSAPVLRTLRLVLVIAPSFILFLAFPAQANASCSGTQANFFTGGQSGSSNSNLGARAVIDIPNSIVGTCGSRDFSDPWVMITDPPAQDWAQVGFGVDYITTTGNPLNPNPKFLSFAQYTRHNSGQGPYTRVWGAPILGSSPTYTDRLGTDGAIHMEVNGTDWLDTSYNASAQWSNLKWQGQYYNEVAYLNSSKVWGTSGDKMNVRDLKVQTGYSTWSTPGTLNTSTDNSARWNVTQYVPSTGNLGMRIWNG